MHVLSSPSNPIRATGFSEHPAASEITRGTMPIAPSESDSQKHARLILPIVRLYQKSAAHAEVGRTKTERIEDLMGLYKAQQRIQGTNSAQDDAWAAHQFSGIAAEYAPGVSKISTNVHQTWFALVKGLNGKKRLSPNERKTFYAAWRACVQDIASTYINQGYDLKKTRQAFAHDIDAKRIFHRIFQSHKNEQQSFRSLRARVSIGIFRGKNVDALASSTFPFAWRVKASFNPQRPNPFPRPLKPRPAPQPAQITVHQTWHQLLAQYEPEKTWFNLSGSVQKTLKQAWFARVQDIHAKYVANQNDVAKTLQDFSGDPAVEATLHDMIQLPSVMQNDDDRASLTFPLSRMDSLTRDTPRTQVASMRI